MAAVPVYYDFASSLCYAAHRVCARVARQLDELGVHLEWTPLDLASLLGWKRGAPVPAPRRANAARVCRELGVPVRIPALWMDSRRALAAELSLDDPSRRLAWRERVFSAVFEESRDLGAPGEVERLARELGWEATPAAWETGLHELERRTRAAADAMVSGVPTFVLDGWPLAGIQAEETLLSQLGRWAQRRRERPA
jgi:predicted DsbA family dithiol-disulfide isomerase